MKKLFNKIKTGNKIVDETLLEVLEDKKIMLEVLK